MMHDDPRSLHRTVPAMLLILGLLMGWGPPAAASARTTLVPGLWRWTLTETTPMGSRTFTPQHCVRAGKQPNFAGTGHAADCYRHERAIQGPGSSVTYRFACTQRNGPMVAVSRGQYIVHITRSENSATLHGVISTHLSGLTVMDMRSTVHGTGRRIGPCH